MFNVFLRLLCPLWRALLDTVEENGSLLMFFHVQLHHYFISQLSLGRPQLKAFRPHLLISSWMFNTRPDNANADHNMDLINLWQKKGMQRMNNSPKLDGRYTHSSLIGVYTANLTLLLLFIKSHAKNNGKELLYKVPANATFYFKDRAKITFFLIFFFILFIQEAKTERKEIFPRWNFRIPIKHLYPAQHPTLPSTDQAFQGNWMTWPTLDTRFHSLHLAPPHSTLHHCYLPCNSISSLSPGAHTYPKLQLQINMVSPPRPSTQTRHTQCGLPTTPARQLLFISSYYVPGIMKAILYTHILTQRPPKSFSIFPNNNHHSNNTPHTSLGNRAQIEILTSFVMKLPSPTPNSLVKYLPQTWWSAEEQVTWTKVLSRPVHHMSLTESTGRRFWSKFWLYSSQLISPVLNYSQTGRLETLGKECNACLGPPLQSPLL